MSPPPLGSEHADADKRVAELCQALRDLLSAQDYHRYERQPAIDIARAALTRGEATAPSSPSPDSAGSDKENAVRSCALCGTRMLGNYTVSCTLVDCPGAIRNNP